MFATWAELFRKEIIDQYEQDLQDESRKRIIKQRVEKILEDYSNEELSSRLINAFRETVRSEFASPFWFKVFNAITELIALSAAGYALKSWDKIPDEVKIPLLIFIISTILSLAIGRAVKK